MPDEFEKPTFDYKFSDKPKNEYDSSSYAPERGGCLTAFLIVLGLAQLVLVFIAFGMLGSVSQYPASSQGIIQFAGFLQIGLSIAAVACVVGLWNWKSWGYYGIYAMYILGALISLFTGAFSSAIGSFVGMGVLYYLMKDKADYLE